MATPKVIPARFVDENGVLTPDARDLLRSLAFKAIDQSNPVLAEPEAAAETETKADEWPKWVELHESHIATSPDTPISVGSFERHIDRAGKVTVLVNNEEEAKRATSPKEEEQKTPDMLDVFALPPSAPSPPEAKAVEERK